MTPALRMLTSIALACIFAAALMFAGTVFGAVRLSRFAVAPTHAQSAPATIRLILQSAGGQQTCAAQGLSYLGAVDGATVTLSGVACAADSIFRNGFEP